MVEVPLRSCLQRWTLTTLRVLHRTGLAIIQSTNTDLIQEIPHDPVIQRIVVELGFNLGGGSLEIVFAEVDFDNA